MAEKDRSIQAPRWGLLMLEGRALLEAAALLASSPLLRRAPRGDGHAVLVLPAFMTSDVATRALRRFLRDRGYFVYGWGLGRNVGPRPELVEGLVKRFTGIRERHGRKVSLVGWSLGGIYARELARNFADDVRTVVTLASPFRNLEAVNLPTFLRAFGNRRLHPEQQAARERLSRPLAVPTTAIYSRSDGIVAWESCAETRGPLRENIEVESSHLGIAHHPVVLLTLADRLAQREGEWKPFAPPPGWSWPLVPRIA